MMRTIFCTLCFVLGIGYEGLTQSIKVTLLGTGVPLPSIERFGPSTLVEANGQFFLFDCGRGVSQRLWQQKISLGKVNRLFITHLHSDHVVGIPDLWLTGWLPANFGKRNKPFEVWGPAGSVEMMEGLKLAYSWDIKTRKLETNKSDSGILVEAHDITEGVVYEQDGVKVTAFLVNHSDFIDSALGYRLDYGGYSVVISGDTRFSENLIKYAKGTDVLVHEVAFASDEMIRQSAIARQILGYHTSPEEAGKVFAQVNPRLAVFSHIASPATAPGIATPDINEMIPITRRHYKGRLEIGEDLMTIEIGSAIEVKRFKK